MAAFKEDMAKVRELIEPDFSEWVKTRPEVIQEMMASHPPDRLYLLKTSNHRVTIYSYSEDKTVTVSVTGDYNKIVFPRNVFGISIGDLEECDLPAPDEELGEALSEPEDIEAYLATKREEQNAHKEA